MDEKAARLIGWSSFLLGLGVAALSFTLEQGSLGTNTPTVALGFGLIGVLSLTLSILTSVITFRSTDYRIGLETDGILRSLRFDLEEVSVLRATIHDYAQGIDRNQVGLDANVRWFESSLWSFFIGTSALIAAMVRLIWDVTQ